MKKINNQLKYVLISSLFCFVVYGNMQSKSKFGKNLYWPSNNSNLAIEVDPRMIEGSLSTSNILSISNESKNSWNDFLVDYNISLIPNYSLPALGTRNTMRFTNNPVYFGEGVLAVTLMSYDNLTGRISTGDILINESYKNNLSFLEDKDQNSSYQAYLGDILTHEFGHFLGLAHNESILSTMYPSLFYGQHKLHHVDENSAHNLSVNKIHIGEISGKVQSLGNKSVYAVGVSLFSATKGAFIASTITDENGIFQFKNLPLGDSYYLYQFPFNNISSLPDVYASANYNICPGRIAPSFFTTCGPRGEGFASQINLDSSNSLVDVGVFSISCENQVASDFLNNKLNSTVNTLKNESGAMQLGVFFPSEIEDDFISSQGIDKFEIDLTSMNLDSDYNYNLLVQLTYTSLNSGIDILIQSSVNGSAFVDYNSNLDTSINRLITEAPIEFSLDTNIVNNLFNFQLIPRWLDETEVKGIFGSLSSTTKKQLQRYAISYKVIKTHKISSEKSIVNASTNYISSNNSCLKGVIKESSRPNIIATGEELRSLEHDERNGKVGLLSCGIMMLTDNDSDNDDDAGNNSQGANFGLFWMNIVSLALGIVLALLFKSFFLRIIKLSKNINKMSL